MKMEQSFDDFYDQIVPDCPRVFTTYQSPISTEDGYDQQEEWWRRPQAPKTPENSFNIRPHDRSCRNEERENESTDGVPDTGRPKYLPESLLKSKLEDQSEIQSLLSDSSGLHSEYSFSENTTMTPKDTEWEWMVFKTSKEALTPETGMSTVDVQGQEPSQIKFPKIDKDKKTKFKNMERMYQQLPPNSAFDVDEPISPEPDSPPPLDWESVIGISPKTCKKRGVKTTKSTLKSPETNPSRLKEVPVEPKSLAEVTADARLVLEALAHYVGALKVGEAQEAKRSMNQDFDHAASSIVSLVLDKSCTKKTKRQETTHKIKSFLVLCRAKTRLYSALSQLCLQISGTRDSLSVLEMMAVVSPLLQELVSDDTETDLYERLSQGLSAGIYQELKDQITRTVTENLAQRKGRRSSCRRLAEAHIESVMEDISTWLCLQLQQKDNPIKTSLRKIRRIVASKTEDQDQQQNIWTSPDPGLKEAAASGAERDVKSSFSSQHFANTQTDTVHWGGLLYEVSSKVLRSKNMDELTAFGKELTDVLEQEKSSWNIQVELHKDSVETIAQAVYKDLCRGRGNSAVSQSARLQPDYNIQVLESIRRHVEKPLQKRTVGSVFRSVCKSFCFWS
uniref:Uncharacterized protein n=1 Tax=Knipowitschia caucasica TaxID=637954 RepID=A0AAV2KP23_KNICA